MVARPVGPHAVPNSLRPCKFFPTRQLPPWLHVLLLLNPLTYGVNAIRGVLLGYEIASVPLNLAVLLAFTLVMLINSYSDVTQRGVDLKVKQVKYYWHIKIALQVPFPGYQSWTNIFIWLSFFDKHNL